MILKEIDMNLKMKKENWLLVIMIPATCMMVSRLFDKKDTTTFTAALVIIVGILFSLAIIVSRKKILRKSVPTLTQRITFIFMSFLALTGFTFLMLIVAPMFYGKNNFFFALTIICSIGTLGLPFFMFVRDTDFNFTKTAQTENSGKELKNKSGKLAGGMGNGVADGHE